MEQSQISSTNTYKDKANALKGRICDLLKWSELEYAEFQYNTGIEFLQYYIPDDPYGADQLICSRIYWAWWRNQWYLREMALPFEFLSRPQWPLSVIRSKYIDMHNAQSLVSSLYIGRVILEQSYAEMIGRVIDDALKPVV
ncbi:hypothetical protein SAMN05428988_1343 [Chitinophaga sp. YR573]|uniref:hypothetical protein n=1 Tax=Chitinophaga sp. YR573 TaxID=1881040 RepID=UPI0008CABF6B|nr:hypothetical protein [Chitinophaga sp. YR573]SEW02239.1 hypothetical protein SAMN05428988_1343 [Chitinophaga sp. YR573]